MRQNIPSGSEYNDLRNALNGIDDLLQDLNNFINDIRISHPSVHSEVILMSEKNQLDFMFDFEGNKIMLDQLQTNPYLIQESWEIIVDDLKNLRKDINFLKNHNKIIHNLELINHIHTGDVKLILNNSGPTGVEITGYHNAIVLKSSPNAGEIGWKNPPPKYSNPNNQNDSYLRGKIRINMIEIDPKTGEKWKVANSSPPNHFKTKKSDNVFWPLSYRTDRINQEMAYVIGQLKTPPILGIVKGIDKKGKITIIYECRATDGHPIEVMFYGGDMNTGKMASIYPKYF